MKPNESLGKNVQPKFLDAPPEASAMLEALRGLGYSTPSAVADIIDNSISANASLVELRFNFKGPQSNVCILDDGCGMDRKTLIRAMRIGTINPLSERLSNDLGRFGLGLKTASFSQSRRLTVSSKMDGAINSFRWDLDILAQAPESGWQLLEGPFPDNVGVMDWLEQKIHGTAVIWELPDKMVTPGFTDQNFLDLIDRVENHLSMVFHRFLDGTAPDMAITINGVPVAPWDPFMVNHPATWSSPIVKYSSRTGPVCVRCHVLPHKDRLSPREFKVAGGPSGWTAQQGFYIYRNRRLLVPGNWLNLGQGRTWTKEEAHKLARIQVDIPNSADHDWKIDVRKSSAVVPVNLRAKLAILADNTRQRARRVFANRGVPAPTKSQHVVEPAWNAIQKSSGTRYRINPDHCAIRNVLENAGELKDSVLSMLRIIEETVPVQRIWLDTAEGKDVPGSGFDAEAVSEIQEVMKVLYSNLIHKKGYSTQEAKSRLKCTEPFHLYPELIDKLSEK